MSNQRNLWKLYPKIEGDEKYGFSKITFIPSDTRQDDPVEGTVEYDDSENTLKVYNGSSWTALGAAETASTGLDGAYDLNPTVTVDGATLTLAGENVDVLTVTQSANDDNIIVTKTGEGAGNCIKITNAGTGDDIQGTSDTWAVTAAGAATFTSLSGVGDVEANDLTLTDSTVSITTDLTDAVAVAIEGDTLTAGTALEIDTDAGTGVTCLDIQHDSSSVFSVRGGDGQLTIAGDAKDTDAIVITDGDITVTDGDIDITSGQFSMTTDGAGDGVTITDVDGNNSDLVYLNGSTQTGSGAILKIDQGAAIRTGHMVDLNMGTTAVGMSAIDINCTGGTRTAPIIAIDSNGTASDFIEMQTSGIFTGNFIEMIQDTSAGTGNFIFINNDSGTSMEAINIDDEANVEDIILINATANTGAGNALINLVADGTPNATANAILVNYTGITDTNTPYAQKIDCSGVDAGALYIDTDAVTDDGVVIHGGGAITNGNAVLAITNDGNLATGGNLFSIDVGGTPHAAAIAFELTSQKDCQAMVIDSDAATDNAVVIQGSGVVGAGKAMLAVTNDAAIADGAFYVDITSGANGASSTDSYLLHVDAAHTNIEAIHVDAGDVLFDENLTVKGTSTLTGAVTATAGVQSASVARTATDAGDGDAVIADGTSFVTVDADSDAAHILTLPTPTPGNIVWIVEDGSTGYELATDTPASVAINGGSGAGASSSIAGAATLVRCVCVSATEWICNYWDADGDEAKVEVAS